MIWKSTQVLILKTSESRHRIAISPCVTTSPIAHAFNRNYSANEPNVPLHHSAIIDKEISITVKTSACEWMEFGTKSRNDFMQWCCEY